MSNLKFLNCGLTSAFTMEEDYISLKYWESDEWGNSCYEARYSIDEFLELTTELKEIAEQLKAEIIE